MTAEEIKNLPPKYILTEEEEARIPSLQEVQKRAFEGEEPIKSAEMSAFLKGRDKAYKIIRQISKDEGGRHDSNAFIAARDYVWRKCFRNPDFADICIVYKHYLDDLSFLGITFD